MTDLTFTHHPRGMSTYRPFRFDPRRKYTQAPWPKPTGFWLSVNDDWRRYCEEGDHEPCTPAIKFEVDLSRVLALSSVEAVDEFHQSYVEPQGPLPRVRSWPWVKLNWEPLTEQFAGIMIAPHISERHESGPAAIWYNPWDCASVCIWDLSVLLVENNLVEGVDFSRQ